MGFVGRLVLRFRGKGGGLCGLGIAEGGSTCVAHIRAEADHGDFSRMKIFMLLYILLDM